MPRILVADDNSNIQKMVTLALKDIGIDVVAVPNGEAAVRKLTDANLDLVLADIFMPVRSGYEVCEYIKHDPRYSHLPVVLLVGAFDPLDEREAQRVGADGILKKPFVPPDPLINMVKSLLAKSASERLAAVAESAAVEAASVEPVVAPAPKPAAVPDFKPPTADFSDTPPEEFVPPVDPYEFGDHESPLAFGNLLDAPTSDDQDLVLTAHRDPSLGEPAWSHPAAIITETPIEETTPEEAIQDHTWGSHGSSFPLAAESTSLPLVTDNEERQTDVEGEGAEVEARAELPAASDFESASEPVTEFVNGQSAEAAFEHAVEETAKDAPEVESAVRGHDFGSDAAEIAAMSAVEYVSGVNEGVLETPELRLASVEQSFSAEAAVTEDVIETQKIEPLVEPEETQAPPELAEAVRDSEPTEEAPTSVVHDAEQVAEPAEIHAAAPEEHLQDAEVTAAAETEATHTGSNGESKVSEFPAWMASAAPLFPAMKPLIVESVEHSFASEAAELSETHVGANDALHADHEVEPAFGEASAAEVEVEHAAHFDGVPATAEAEPAVEEMASADTAVEHEVAASAEPVEAHVHIAELGHATEPGHTNGATLADSHVAAPRSIGSGAQSPEIIEAVVSRIVERMQPKILDVVTNEILRPLVEAMVRREMEKE